MDGWMDGWMKARQRLIFVLFLRTGTANDKYRPLPNNDPIDLNAGAAAMVAFDSTTTETLRSMHSTLVTHDLLPTSRTQQ
jgi:hypothetical protein